MTGAGVLVRHSDPRIPDLPADLMAVLDDPAQAAIAGAFWRIGYAACLDTPLAHPDFHDNPGELMPTTTTTVIATPEDLDDLLERPGTTSRDYAAYLRAHHITGDLSGPDSCVIANWIREETGAASVMVDGVAVEVWFHHADELPHAHLRVSLPDGARELVNDFDDGLYPDLIAGEVQP